MKTLTPKTKSLISQDWQSVFPSMGVCKPLHLMKRVGPVLVGVCLDRRSGNSSYVPTSHVHCLLRPSPVVRLTLGQTLVKKSGIVREISVAIHESVFAAAAQDLARQSYVPLHDAVSFDAITSAYRRYLKSNNPSARYPVRLYEDMVLLHAWYGDRDQAGKLIEHVLDSMKTWPQPIIDREGGAGAWEQNIRNMLMEPSSLNNVLREQIDALELNGIPSTEM